MTAKKPVMCGSCKRSGIYNQRAEVEFKGWRFVSSWSEKKVNIHAKYCADHLDCFIGDGGTVTFKRDIPKEKTA